MKNKYVQVILLWLFLAVIILVTSNGRSDSKTIINRCEEVKASVSDITKSRVTKKSEDSGEWRGVNERLSYYVEQEMVLEFEYKGNNYKRKAGKMETYVGIYTGYATSFEEKKMLQNYGYKKGDTVLLYVDKTNPEKVYLKSSLDKVSSPKRASIITFVVIGVGLVFTLLIIRRKKCNI